MKTKYPNLVYGYSKKNTDEKPHGYKAYNETMSINADAAMYGTSYGAFQIMGFHYQDAGFKSLKEFVDAQSTMSGQVESFITFIANNQVLLKAMKTKNFT